MGVSWATYIEKIIGYLQNHASLCGTEDGEDDSLKGW